MSNPNTLIVYVVTGESGAKLKLFSDGFKALKFAKAGANRGSYELQFDDEKDRMEYLIRRQKEGVPMDKELASELGRVL